MYLLAYTTQTPGGQFVDHWCVTRTIAEAEREYCRLCEDAHVYSATICQPVKSTEPHYMVQVDE